MALWWNLKSNSEGIRERRPIFYFLTLLFLVALFAMAYTKAPYPFILLLIFLYAALFVIGIFLHNTALFAPILVPDKEVGNWTALTFDDGPDPISTPKILDILREKGVKATFFCVGKHVRKEPELLKRIHQEGHQVANHTENHPFLINFYSAKGLAKEILSCQEAIHSIIGLRPRYFRQVCGMVNINLGLIVKELDLILVGWQVSSRDMHKKTPEEIVRQIQRKIRPGAICLFHDGGIPRSMVPGDFLSKALPEIIDRLREKGFSFLTVKELHMLHKVQEPCR